LPRQPRIFQGRGSQFSLTPIGVGRTEYGWPSGTSGAVSLQQPKARLALAWASLLRSDERVEHDFPDLQSAATGEGELSGPLHCLCAFGGRCRRGSNIVSSLPALTLRRAIGTRNSLRLRLSCCITPGQLARRGSNIVSLPPPVVGVTTFSQVRTCISLVLANQGKWPCSNPCVSAASQ
jgi:hypothetical protein